MLIISGKYLIFTGKINLSFLRLSNFRVEI